MTQDERDLLIRLDQKMDDVRSDVAEIKRSQNIQWEKMNETAEKTTANSSSIHWLTWAVRSIVGAIIVGTVGVVLYAK